MRHPLIACLLTLALVLPSAAFGASVPEQEHPAYAAPPSAAEFLARMVDAEAGGQRPSLDGDGVAGQALQADEFAAADWLSGTLDVVSLAGANRFETAVRVSQHAYPYGSEAVVITDGYNWPDALSGASLAGMIDAPILPTPPAALPSSILKEIGRLDAGSAVILGGTGAVSSAIENELVKRMGRDQVLRIEGRDRYETSAKIAMLVLDVQEEIFGYHDCVSFVATGADFPDALGASPLAAATWWPTVLVNPAGVGPASAAVLKRGATDAAIMLGGSGALSANVASAIASMTGQAPLRLSGADRYDTALQIAEWGVDELGMQWDGVAIATGRDFPDALAGGVMQGRTYSVMLLTPGDSLPTSVAKTLSRNADWIYEVRYLGGTSAVRQPVRNQVETILYKEPAPNRPGPINPIPRSLWEPWADLPDTGSYVYLDSDAGDYIGRGQEYLYTQADAIITVSASGGCLSVQINGDEWWNGQFQTPDEMSKLEVGYYPGVARYPFHDPEWGGLDWSGEGRGSSRLTGWFVVDSVTYEGGVLKAIELRFEQHSESATPALHGAIRWVADDPTAPAGPVNPIPGTLWQPSADLPATGTYVYLDSDTGDYIGGGKEYLYTPANATITASASGGHLYIAINGEQWWYGNFRTMHTISKLQVGYYPGLKRYPFHNPALGGLDWSGQGRGSSTLTGWFVVDSATYEGGVLKAIDLRFEQHSGGKTPALHGAIRWVAGG